MPQGSFLNHIDHKEHEEELCFSFVISVVLSLAHENKKEVININQKNTH